MSSKPNMRGPPWAISVPKRAECAVDVPPLAASVAIVAGERGAAVEAIPLRRMAVRKLAGARFDGLGEHSAGRYVTQGVQIRHRPFPGRILGAARRPC